MTDLVVAVRLTAQDGGLSGQLKLTKGEMAGLKGEAGATAVEVGKLSTSTDRVTRSTTEAANAVKGGAESLRIMKTAADQLGLAQGRAERGNRNLKQSGDAAAESARQQRAMYQQLGFQVQDVFASFASGINPMVILAQQGGQVASALSGARGVAGRVATFLAGPYGAAVFGAATVVGLLATNLFESADASDEATKALAEFARHQSDIGNFIDDATGKLKEQNRTLVRNAILLRQTKIDQNSTAVVGKRNEAFAAAAQVRGDPTPIFTAGGVTRPRVDKDLQAAIDAAGESVVKLDANLQALVRRRPDLRETVKQVSDLAGQAVLLQRDSQTAAKEIRALQGDTKALGGVAKGSKGDLASLTEAQARLAAATTPLAKAQETLRLVQIRGRKALTDGTLSAADYKRQLVAAEGAVDKARAAEEGATRARAAGRKALTALNKETREAEQAQRELARTLAGLEARFDPAAAAARKYADTLAEIGRLEGAGSLSPDRAAHFRIGAALEERDRAAAARDADNRIGLAKDLPDITDRLAQDLPAIAKGWGGDMERAARGAGRALRDEGIDAAQAITQILGGKVGNILGPVLGLMSGNASGNFNSLGGRTGGLMTLLAGGTGVSNPFTEGFKEGLGGFTDSMNGLFSKVFGENGPFTASLGKTLGKAGGGAATGSMVAGVSNALGLKMSNTGAQIGGAIGSFLPIPGGQIIGSIAGGLIGKLFGKTKSGSVTLTDADSDLRATGNSSSAKTAALGLGGAVQEGLKNIVDVLGGTLGGFSVTVGERHGDFRVRSTPGSLKVKKGAKDFNDDGEAAAAYAIQLAIQQGAVQGLSAAVQKAIRSSPDLDKAVAEALGVQNLEMLIGGPGSEIGKLFRDFEREAQNRVRLARQYGLDLVKVEELNAKDRAAVLDQALQSRVGGLTQLLKDLTIGDLAEGTPAEQRQALLAERDKALTDARAGVDGAADQLADINRRLVELSRDAFGTAGPELAGDRGAAKSAAEEIIALENARVKAQADAAAATNTKLEKGNTLLNEGNNIAAEQLAVMRQLLAQRGIVLPAGGLAVSTARSVAL